MPEVLTGVDLVVSRAGAKLAELTAFKPSVNSESLCNK